MLAGAAALTGGLAYLATLPLARKLRIKPVFVGLPVAIVVGSAVAAGMNLPLPEPQLRRGGQGGEEMSRPTRGAASAQIVLAWPGTYDMCQRRPKRSLWQALRGRRLAGLKFRRQHPFGPFVLDMFCVEPQLVIEVDGGIHATPEQADYDAARTEYLADRGLRVLRFTNEEVMQKLAEVLSRILRDASPPTPLRPPPLSRRSGEGE